MPQPGNEICAVYVDTLGCAKNQVDSEVLCGFLLRQGYCLADSPQQAHVILVNTCGFIEPAVRESIDAIMAYADMRRAVGDPWLVVCGCLPQRYQADLATAMPEADLLLGPGEIPRIGSHLDRLRAGKTSGRLHVGRQPYLMSATSPRVLLSLGTSAYVKIAEGCSNNCSYCTIPLIRGPYRSRAPGSIIREARQLAAAGICEICLISQDSARYPDLDRLLARLARIDGLDWIRLLYCHPRHIHDEVIRVMADEEKICRYLDLPVQHIAPRVLSGMGRVGDAACTRSLLETLRKRIPELAVRTTMMVGFPGETDRDFEILLDFAAEQRFEHLGAFMYQQEEGTAAARLPRQVPDTIKRERLQRLLTQQRRISRDYTARLRGRTLKVLVEGPAEREPYLVQARSEWQAPEVDGVVYLSDNQPIGSFCTATITRTLTYDLVGRVLPD